MTIKAFSTIHLDRSTKAKLEHLVQITGCKSQNEFLDLVISPLFEVSHKFVKADLSAYPLIQRQNVVYQFTKAPELEIIEFNGDD